MIIYKIMNKINKKIYIGKTKNNVDTYFGSGMLIKRAISKYGINNFIKDIIDEASSIEELNNKEKYWIKYYNSTNIKIGYNIMKGGDGGDNFTNNPNKEEIRKKYSKNGKKNGMFGRKHTDESKRKISEHKKGQRKGMSTWNKGISIKKYSPSYIKTFSERKGAMNSNAKKFTFISPKNITYHVYGNYIMFCREHNLDLYTSRHFINKGKIPAPQKGNPKNERINLIDWEIKKIN